MDKRQRRKVQVKTVPDVSEFGQITKEQLLLDSEMYDPENYNSLERIEEKVLVVPDNKTEIVTIRMNQKENDLLKQLASQNGISKSAFLRNVIIKTLKEGSKNTYNTNFEGQELMSEVLNKLHKIDKKLSKLESLEKKVTDVTRHVFKQEINNLSQYSVETYGLLNFDQYVAPMKYPAHFII